MYFLFRVERLWTEEELDDFLIEKLRDGWSPQQIAGRAELEAVETVSHESVYALHRDQKRGGKLYRLLKRFGKRKQRLGDRDSTARCPGRVGIEERPAVVEERSRLGDHEADPIVGDHQSGCVLTVQDRASRKTVLRKLQTTHDAGARAAELALRKTPHEVHSKSSHSARNLSVAFDR